VRTLVLVIAAAALAACTTEEIIPFPPKGWDREKAEAAALAGDVQASNEVAYYYETHGTPAEQLRWYRVSAEAGSATGMQLLALALERQGGRTACAEAIELHRKVAVIRESEGPGRGRTHAADADRLEATRAECEARGARR